MNFFDYLDEYNNRSRSSTPDSNTIASASTPIGQQDLSRLVSTSLEGPNGGASNTASTSSLRNSSTFSVLTNTTSSTPETNNNNNNNNNTFTTSSLTFGSPLNTESPTPTPEGKNPFDWKKAAKIAAIVVGVALVALAVLAILTGLSVIFPGAVPVLAALVGISAAAAGWTVFGVGVGAAVAGTTTALLAGYSLHTTSTKKTTPTPAQEQQIEQTEQPLTTAQQQQQMEQTEQTLITAQTKAKTFLQTVYQEIIEHDDSPKYQQALAIFLPETEATDAAAFQKCKMMFDLYMEGRTSAPHSMVWPIVDMIDRFKSRQISDAALEIYIPDGSSELPTHLAEYSTEECNKLFNLLLQPENEPTLAEILFEFLYDDELDFPPQNTIDNTNNNSSNNNSNTTFETDVDSNSSRNNLNDTTTPKTMQTEEIATSIFNNLTPLLNTRESNHGEETKTAAETFGNSSNNNSNTTFETDVDSNPSRNNLDDTTTPKTIQPEEIATPTFNNLTPLLNTIESNHDKEARTAAENFINDYISENRIADLTQKMPLDLLRSLNKIFSPELESSEPEKITRRNSMSALSDLDTHTDGLEPKRRLSF